MAEIKSSSKDATELFVNKDRKGETTGNILEMLKTDRQKALYETDSHGNTRLHHHSLVGNTEIVALLLDSFQDRFKLEAYVNQRNDFGEIAMHKAALNGHFGIVVMLDTAGSDHLAREKMGDTPLSLARKGTANNGVTDYLMKRLVLRAQAAEEIVKMKLAFSNMAIGQQMKHIERRQQPARRAT